MAERERPMIVHPALSSLARPEVTALPVYSTDTAVCAIDLSDNTNLWGAPPAALSVLQDAASASLSRYPTLYSEPLRAELLDYLGVGSDSTLDTVMGCGSDDVLDSCMRAFSADGASIAYAAPTFSMIPVLARLNGLQSVAVPVTADFAIDADRLVDARAAITSLCTPNIPTASPASRAAIEFVVRHSEGVVLLDEAYAEFAPETFAGLIRDN